MARKPATVTGFIMRTAFLAIAATVTVYFFKGPTAFTKVGAVIVAAVLAPGMILGVVQQIRLRRALRRTPAGQGPER